MAFNRYMTKAPQEFSFYREPIEALSQALQVRQQTYDKNAAMADQLLSLSVDALDKDRAQANAITRGYHETVDKLAEKYQGDYSKMGRELMGVARNVRKDFTSGGLAHAVEFNKKQYDKWLDFSQKASLSGKGPSVQQVNLGSQYILGNYQGVGYNKDTGTFNTLQTPQLVEYQEMSELVDYFAKNVVPNKLAAGEWEVGNGKIWAKNKVGIEEITPDRIQLAVKEGLNSHQGWRAYEDQMGQFGAPITEETYNSQINRAINSFAYRWVNKDQDIMVNPYALEDYKNQDKAGPEIPSFYSNARVSPTPTKEQEEQGAKGIPRKFDATELITVMGGTFNRKGKTLDEYMTRDDTKSKYGVFGQNLYASLKGNKEFQSLSDAQKAMRFKELYEEGHAEFSRTRDVIYAVNDKSKASLTDQFLRSGKPADSRFTVIDHKGNVVITGASPNELANVVPGGFEVRRLATEGEVVGITNPGAGLPFGLEIANPNARQKNQARYRVIMEGFDVRAEEASKNLQQLYFPRYGGSTESPWVPLAQQGGRFMAKALAQPMFDSEGKFVGTDEAIVFQGIEFDPNTGRPVQQADGSYKFSGDPFVSGYKLQDVVDEEFKMTGLRYQSLKLKDDKF
jgi:hypothetical protein